jgi:hypothetical protein
VEGVKKLRPEERAVLGRLPHVEQQPQGLQQWFTVLDTNHTHRQQSTDGHARRAARIGGVAAEDDHL